MITKNNTPVKWSAHEFERRVLGANPKVAVFDCDGTLWSGDSGSGFMYWSMEQGLVPPATVEWIGRRYREYQAGAISEVDICGDMVLIYAGLNEAELRSAAARFADEFVPPRLFAEMISLLSTLQDKGVEIWAVSSTNLWVIHEAVRGLGIGEDHILAAELRVKDGILTREIVDVPTDERKATALARAGIARPDAVFGNSIHDLAMLEIAGQAFPVNPSPALLEAAGARGWGYFLPSGAKSTSAAVGGE
jgi:phosphoserine phosphatase